MVWSNDIRTYHGKTWQLPHLRTSTFRPQFMILFTNKINKKGRRIMITLTKGIHILIHLISTFLSLLISRPFWPSTSHILHWLPVLPPSFASSLPSSTGLQAAFAPFASHPVPRHWKIWKTLTWNVPKAFYFLPIEKKRRSASLICNSLLETLGKNISVSKISCDAKVSRFHGNQARLTKNNGFLSVSSLSNDNPCSSLCKSA